VVDCFTTARLIGCSFSALDGGNMNYRFMPNRIHKFLIMNTSFNSDHCRDLAPVLKLFTPDDNAVWLFVKTMRNNSDIAYGLIDIGQGNPHMGYVDLKLLASVRGKMGLPIEHDVNFLPRYPLWVYHVASTIDGQYTEDETILSSILQLREIQPKIIYPKPSMN